MTVTIRFLGAAGTVTGSKYLVADGNVQILVDAGLFQGAREWRERNWHDPGIELAEIDAVLLTHAHIDHTGILPRYYHMGLRCPVFCTSSTFDLASLLLPDSGRLQEEEATWRREKKRSRHQPPLPLYTEQDARGALQLFRAVAFHEKVEVLPAVNATWTRMGHILGAASIQLEIGGKVITFSGDVGRYSIPILHDPAPVSFGDLLLIESTYGDRQHSESDPKEKLTEVIKETQRRGGVVVIPSFAVGRTQLLLYYLRELKDNRAIPDLPIIIDSPMATDATRIYRENPDCYDEEALGIVSEGRQPFHPSKLGFTRSRRDSIKLNSIAEPMVLISASGMLSGGRILHHLKHRLSSPLNTVLFVGFQPPGGRGHWLKSGAKSLRILGKEVLVRAQIEEITGLSAHADCDELLQWCRSSTGKPSKVAIVHGEPDSARAFAKTLEAEFAWDCAVPGYREELQVG